MLEKANIQVLAALRQVTLHEREIRSSICTKPLASEHDASCAGDTATHLSRHPRAFTRSSARKPHLHDQRPSKQPKTSKGNKVLANLLAQNEKTSPALIKHMVVQKGC